MRQLSRPDDRVNAGLLFTGRVSAVALTSLRRAGGTVPARLNARQIVPYDFGRLHKPVVL